jgi:hypothetical protein
VVTQLRARSISSSVKDDAFAERASHWRVLAAFENTCNLSAPNGSIFALVLHSVGDGPLNVVVDGWPGVFARSTPDVPVHWDTTTLRLGGLEVCLNRAVVWDPQPNWKRLHRTREEIDHRLPSIRELALPVAPANSLLVGQATDSLYASRVWEAIQGLRGAENGEWFADGQAAALATRFAGLGGGLTPAGDDFLAGVMLRAWLTQTEPRPFCQAMLNVAAPRTNRLSAAFLRAAASGECSAAWHFFFDKLYDGTQRELFKAVQSILAYGHTSGADMLAGFLYSE